MKVGKPVKKYDYMVRVKKEKRMEIIESVLGGLALVAFVASLISLAGLF